MSSDVMKSIKDDSVWIRGLYMVLFFIIHRLLGFVILLLSIVQFLFALIASEENAQLRRFGDSLGQYSSQIIHFLSFRSQRKPFPFSDWPTPTVDAEHEEV